MTDYYVLSPLGPHSAGDVLSFSPEQIGAGVDITHLTSIGAIRVATPLLSPPLAPTLATAGSGGTVAAGVYTVKISYVTASGETTPSPSTTITTSGATSTLTVNSPASATGATGWYAYVSQVGGSTLTRQQTSPTPIATNLVLTAPPTSSGLGPRGTNTSGEAARSVPAQIQAVHAPPGVGVFAINGSPVNGPAGSYANIAAYGSVGIDASVSPPAFYTNLGTIASPTWTAAGGGSIAGLTSDGQTPGGIVVAGRVQSKALLLAAYCGTVTVPAGSTGTPLPISSVIHDDPAFTATVGQSAITVNDPGWYSVTVFAKSQAVGEAGAIYRLDEGGAMDFADGQPPEDYATADTTRVTILESTGYLLFTDVNKTLQMELSNSGATGKVFFPYIMASYLGPA